MADDRVPLESPGLGFCVDPGILVDGARNSLLGLRRNGTCRLGDPFFGNAAVLDRARLVSLESVTFPLDLTSSRVDWRSGDGDLRKTGDLTPMPALIGEALEALMLLAEGSGGGIMYETSLSPAEPRDTP